MTHIKLDREDLHPKQVVYLDYYSDSLEATRAVLRGHMPTDDQAEFMAGEVALRNKQDEEERVSR